ncbi:hypothetical protein R1sor_002383 [Riccia sorocarpa]|uniref:Strictosidine synthase conserved region domain-containing protein n=1 Tax=Riccia sorocarpa TaxID=122646 RepID=A0ABD3H0S8_9MARC
MMERNNGAGRRSVVSILGLWLIVILTALPGGLSDPKTELQVIEFKYRQLYPERFAWDARHKRFVLGSSILGKLVTLTDRGDVEDFVAPKEFEGQSKIRGVFVEASRNRILAVVEAMGEDSEHTDRLLVAYDLDSRERTLMVKLTEDTDDGKDQFFFKDVCVDDKGNAYITESSGNTIWEVTSSGKKSLLAVISQAPALVKEAGLREIGANGIVCADGFLLVNQFNSGALFRVNLSNGKVDNVKIGNGFVQLPEADGMTLREDGALVVVSAHSAWLLKSSDAWVSASLIDKVALDKAVCSTSAVTKDLRVYVLASYLKEVTDSERETFQVQEIEFAEESADSPLYLLLIIDTANKDTVPAQCPSIGKALRRRAGCLRGRKISSLVNKRLYLAEEVAVYRWTRDALLTSRSFIVG